MKIKRFLSLFFAVMISLHLAPLAAADADSPVLPEDPNILAKAALLVDANTGLPIYAKNEHEELYPASLTKIMTALLVFEAIEDGKLSMDQMLTASSSALMGLADDGSTAGIQPCLCRICCTVCWWSLPMRRATSWPRLSAVRLAPLWMP